MKLLKKEFQSLLDIKEFNDEWQYTVDLVQSMQSLQIIHFFLFASYDLRSQLRRFLIVLDSVSN